LTVDRALQSLPAAAGAMFSFSPKAFRATIAPSSAERSINRATSSISR
jgi:hypothetical protein